MSLLTKQVGRVTLLFLVTLFQTMPALARSDDLIQREIEAKLAESETLGGVRIEVHVEERLVVLIGEARLYEQKLISERIAWRTPDVDEVDNEVRVVPRLPLSDTAIERLIQEIVKDDERFRKAGVVIRVEKGEVFLMGSFLSYRDPTILKHKVAKIEGVIDITIRARFVTQPGVDGTRNVSAAIVAAGRRVLARS